MKWASNPEPQLILRMPDEETADRLRTHIRNLTLNDQLLFGFESSRFPFFFFAFSFYFLYNPILFLPESRNLACINFEGKYYDVELKQLPCILEVVLHFFYPWK